MDLWRLQPVRACGDGCGLRRSVFCVSVFFLELSVELSLHVLWTSGAARRDNSVSLRKGQDDWTSPCLCENRQLSQFGIFYRYEVSISHRAHFRVPPVIEFCIFSPKRWMNADLQAVMCLPLTHALSLFPWIQFTVLPQQLSDSLSGTKDVTIDIRRRQQFVYSHFIY